MRWLTLESSSVIVTPASAGLHFRVLLTSDATLEPPFEGASGQRIIYRVEQDSVGSHTLTPNPGDTATPSSPGFTTLGTIFLNPAAGSVSLLEAFYDDETGRWDIWGLPDLSSVYALAGAAPANHGITHLPGGTDEVFDSSSQYTVSGLSALRDFNPTTVTLENLGHVVGTIITDLAQRKIPTT